MNFEIKRSIEDNVSALSCSGAITDAELDEVFSDPANDTLWADLTGARAEHRTRTEKADDWAALVKLVEALTADTIAPAPAEPEEPIPPA